MSAKVIEFPTKKKPELLRVFILFLDVLEQRGAQSMASRKFELLTMVLDADDASLDKLWLALPAKLKRKAIKGE